MNRKGLYFFVIDAFIGGIIIITAIIITTTQFSSKSSPSTTYYTAEDFMTVIDTTQIRDYGYSNDNISKMVQEKNITNTQLTLIEQLALFQLEGKAAQMQRMGSALLLTVPQGTSINIREQSTNTQIASRVITEFNDSSTVYVSQRIIILKKNATKVYPPVVIEVKTWQ